MEYSVGVVEPRADIRLIGRSSVRGEKKLFSSSRLHLIAVGIREYRARSSVFAPDFATGELSHNFNLKIIGFAKLKVDTLSFGRSEVSIVAKVAYRRFIAEKRKDKRIRVELVENRSTWWHNVCLISDEL